ncbi:MAG: hypothetical protein EOL95_05165 [Bacteroidia bacterium]|nr:hypothetical protein [Bacteroidia bacterium]
MNKILSFLKFQLLRFISLLFALLVISNVLKAQTTLSGIVKDANDNTPLIGASVFVESLNVGGITDSNGKYSLQMAVGIIEGLVTFGLATESSNGFYTYNPSTGEASSSAVVTTEGYPYSFVSFE